jgi:SnoaL-like domain
VWKASAADVRAFIAAVNRRDVESVIRLFTEDAVLTGGPRFQEPIVGLRNLRQMFELYFRGFSEMLFTPGETFFDRNEVVTFMTLTGSLAGPVPGIEPSRLPAGSSRISWRGAYRFVFDPQGKISYLSIYGDESTARWLV